MLFTVANQIWREEGWVLLETRLKILTSKKQYTRAAQVLELLIRIGMDKFNLLSSDAITNTPGGTPISLSSPFRFPKETMYQYLEIFVLFWSRQALSLSLQVR